MTSLAELDGRVFQGLYAAGEYLQLEQVHNAVVQALNARTMESRSSDINVLLATSDEFTPDAIPYDITSLIEKGTPKWVESRYVALNNATWWYPVRSVPLSQFNDYQRRGAYAVAFHGEEPDNDDDQAIQYASFTFLPENPCRIRFSRDRQRTAMTSDFLLPNNIADLIVLDAQSDVISDIKLRIAMDLRNDERGRANAQIIMAALDDVRTRNFLKAKPLEYQWRSWAFRDRSADEAFNLPTPSSEWLYPGGRAKSWGGYGSWSG